ncbi:MAG: 4Fe-4S dicluster domain-containing protein [Spirochaetaceae bacterium]|nr:4Fe-4S dicluster domain-containing protein [Spirochaetaceae bacterium]
MAKKGRIEIDGEKCKGCYLCISVCPAKVIEPAEIPNKQGVFAARAAGGGCVACGSCYVMCPDICITVFETEGAS